MIVIALILLKLLCSSISDFCKGGYDYFTHINNSQNYCLYV